MVSTKSNTVLIEQRRICVTCFMRYQMGFWWSASHSLCNIWHFHLSSIVHVDIMAEYRGKGRQFNVLVGNSSHQNRPSSARLSCMGRGNKVESFVMFNAEKFEYNPFGLQSCMVYFAWAFNVHSRHGVMPQVFYLI